jgi:hypothetical protein
MPYRLPTGVSDRQKMLNHQLTRLFQLFTGKRIVPAAAIWNSPFFVREIPFFINASCFSRATCKIPLAWVKLGGGQEVARRNKRQAGIQKTRTNPEERHNEHMKTKRANLSILRDFYKYNGQNLGTFGGNVGASIDPALFPNLPVPPSGITALSADLIAKQGATLTGGTPETAARDKAFDALADALNADANIVENVVGTNLEMLLATGFLPVSTNRASSPLDDTDIVSLLNNGTTQALLQLLPVRNAKSYQLQISTDGGKTWVEAGISTRATRIVLPNLTPGTTYAVRARAIGGSTGASAWTAPRSIMST